MNKKCMGLKCFNLCLKIRLVILQSQSHIKVRLITGEFKNWEDWPSFAQHDPQLIETGLAEVASSSLPFPL